MTFCPPILPEPIGAPCGSPEAAIELAIVAKTALRLALFEYLIQVPENRYGYQTMNLSRLEILQEVVTLAVFVPRSPMPSGMLHACFAVAPTFRRASWERALSDGERGTEVTAGNDEPGNGRFDEEIAAFYDQSSQDMYRPEVLGPTIGFLAELAGEGAALELGVGTGRVALPLSARGVPVHGIDVSEPMLARLRAKPGSDRIAVTIGDLATTRVPGAFRLVFLVFNTITNLTTQEEQLACFRNAAEHLDPGGCFVIEVFVPQLRRLPPGERARAFDVRRGHIGLDEYTDFTNQILWSHHYWIHDGRQRTFSAPFRYVWPAELDLMARLAGLTLRERWASWSREPFTDESTSHVSVWQKPER